MDSEWEELPCVILTSDIDWDPAMLDYPTEDNKEQFNVQTEIEEDLNLPLLNEFGNCRNRINIGEYKLYFFDTDSYLESNVDNIILEYMKHLNSGYVEFRKKKLNYKSLKSYFNQLPRNIIKKTFKLAMKHARTPTSTILKKNFKFS